MSSPTFHSHLSVLESSAKSYPTRPAFRTPVVNKETSQISEWATVTYAQFHQDVELYARHWISVLSTDGVPPGSVVGLWLGGTAYTDVLHIYGMSRAGYIPQMLSSLLTNPILIFELLQKADAHALVWEPSFDVDLSRCSVPTHSAVQISERDVTNVVLPPLPVNHSASDVVLILHTSGSSSGSPKLVPYNRRFLDTTITKENQLARVLSTQGQDVTVAIGNMCHCAQTNRLMASLYHGSCTIQPTSTAFSSEELLDMIARCGLNRLRQFSSYIDNHLRNSKTDPKLLQALIRLDEVQYGGLPLGREEEAWAIQNGINLLNVFGSTEVGGILLSVRGKGQDPSLFVPFEGTSFIFSPIEPDYEPSPSTGRLLELVVPPESNDCPDISLRHPDGYFHSGDLFVEVGTGKYLSRGRKDDWINTECGGRCDTKTIEENVRTTCGELVSECIAVGSGRPSPTLFVEVLEKCSTDAKKLKEEIIRRTKEFHSLRFIHERITSTTRVVVVGRNSLPRTATKGNIRRRAVEDQYKELLDDIYGTLSKQ